MILNAIYKFNIIYGYYPSIINLQQETGIKSLSSIYFHVKKLREEGYICIKNNNISGISITQKGLGLLKEIENNKYEA
ncbi:hypothetical protein [Tepidibacter sp. Z1-5]|uniref:LexA family protein n=1 Tax=Tepidibacter sp. Z1-5 TaxID=3134138 RepID=UPI00404096F7